MSGLKRNKQLKFASLTQIPDPDKMGSLDAYILGIGTQVLAGISCSNFSLNIQELVPKFFVKASVKVMPPQCRGPLGQ